jgi:hypothetical protein
MWKTFLKMLKQIEFIGCFIIGTVFTTAIILLIYLLFISFVTSPPPAKAVSNWNLIFKEDFNKETKNIADYKNIFPYPAGWKDTSKIGNYSPDILSSSAGILNINICKDKVAAISPRVSLLYGKVQVRMKVPFAPGYKVAALLWPVSEKWPDDGEIDFAEGDLDSKPLSAFMHFARNEGGQDYFNYKINPNEFHTYEVVWLPDLVKFKIDGKIIGSSQKFIPNKLMRSVIQFEISPPIYFGNSKAEIDFIKIYKLGKN